MEDNSLYVYVLRTENLVIGVYAEKQAALAADESFTTTHSKLFPQEPVRKVYLDRHVVIGGTAKGEIR